MQGCAEWLDVWVEGMKTRVHAFAVPDAPFCLLLGRPRQKSVMLRKEETNSGVDITIFDLQDKPRSKRISTRERRRCEGGCTLMYRSVEDVVEAWKSEMACEVSAVVCLGHKESLSEGFWGRAFMGLVLASMSSLPPSDSTKALARSPTSQSTRRCED